MAKKKHHHGLLKVATLLGAISGVYYLYGADQAKKNRKKAHGWMMKLKGDVLTALEGLESIDEERYNKVVDQVKGRYQKLKTVNSKEAESLARDLKKHWKQIASKAVTKAKTKIKKNKA